MAVIDHPRTDDSIDVEIIDRESHHGEYVQVEAVDETIDLSDESGDQPWFEADRVMDA